MQKSKLFIFALVILSTLLAACSNTFSKVDKTSSVSFSIPNKVFKTAYNVARGIIPEDIDAQDFTLEVYLFDTAGNQLGKIADTVDKTFFRLDETEEKFSTDVAFTDVPVNTEVYAEALIYYTSEEEKDEDGNPLQIELLQGKSDSQKVVKEGIILKLKLNLAFALTGISVTLSDVEYDDGSVISSIEVDESTGTLTAKVDGAIDLNKITVTWILGDQVVTDPSKPASRDLEFNLFTYDIPYQMGKNDITLLIMYDGVPYTAKTTLDLTSRE